MFKKVAMGLTFALAAVVVAPGVSSAAVAFQDFGMTVNGHQTDEVRAGNTYKLGFALDVDSGDEVEYVQVRHVDENGDIPQIPQCFKIDPRLVNVDDKQVVLTVKTVSDLPDGPYDVLLRTFGIPGLSNSNGCDLDNLGDEMTFEDRLFINHDSDVENTDTTIGGGSSTPVGAPSEFDQLFTAIGSMTKSLTALAELIKAQNAAPAPSTKPCPPSGTTTQVQAWLMANGYSAPFHAAGVYMPTGYWGPITTNAYAQAMTACK